MLVLLHGSVLDDSRESKRMLASWLLYFIHALMIVISTISLWLYYQKEYALTI